MAAPPLPPEIEQLRRELIVDQAPSSRSRTEIFRPGRFVQRYGRPYSSRRLPVSTLEEMRTDALLRFAQMISLVPIFTGKWRIQCANPRKAQFVDHALRQIIGRLILQFFESWNFGFQVLVKEFALTNPDWVFLDKEAEGGAKVAPVWDGGPDVPALIWQPFVPLSPRAVAPVWTPGGAFNGVALAQNGVGYGLPTVPFAQDDFVDILPELMASFVNSDQQQRNKIDVDHALWITNERDAQWGCSPADEPVLTTDGYVPIGELDPEKHRLASYTPSLHRILRGGFTQPGGGGFAFEKGVRPYSGDLLTIKTNLSKTRVTPNHKLTVRWNEGAVDRVWCVYLMRKGDWWRIGTTRLHRKGAHDCSGVFKRLNTEQADDAWILATFESKRDALYYEHLWSGLYNVPEMTFVMCNGVLTTSDLEEIWGAIDSRTGAIRLLAARNLVEQLPLYRRESTGQFSVGGYTRKSGRYSWTIAAANLIPGLMQLPADPGEGNKAVWSDFVIERERFEGDVYSLEVEPHHHYISGGLVTQNSIWGRARLAYAFKYWWSYEMTLGILNRSVERKGDPTIVVSYPQGKSMVSGQEVDNQTIAMQIGESARSGAVLAVPSEVWGEDMATANQASKWRIDYLKAEERFDELRAVLDYLDTMKIRSMMVAELSFAEGSGGCLDGDTPILCPRDHGVYPDGVPLEDVEPGRLVWAFNQESMRFELWPVKGVWCTMDDADLYRLTLDDGQEIVGTPDHPFMSRDGVWRRMDELKPGDRLMPFYESGREISYSGAKLSEGDYEPMVLLDPDHGSFEIEYRVIGEHLGWTGQGARVNIHHDDGRHANTELGNLHRLTPGQHAEKHFRDPVHRQKHSDAVRAAMAALTPEKRAKLGKEHWDEARWKAFSERQAIVGLEAITKFRDSLTPEEYKAWCTSRAKATQDARRRNGTVTVPPRDKRACRGCGGEFQPRSSNSWYCQTCNETRNVRTTARVVDYEPGATNHRVVSVERLGETGPVWDLEIDGPPHVRNFVAGGVVVHNTSSRNVAAVVGERTSEAQILTQAEWDEVINSYMIPQLANTNFPELADVPARKVTQSFGEGESALASDILKSLANSNPGELPLDVPALLERFQIDALTGTDLEKWAQRMATQAETNTQPPKTPATTETAGVTDTGFYVAGREGIVLEDDVLLASLPKSKHYSDSAVLAQTRLVRRLYKALLSAQYEDFAVHVARADLSLAEGDGADSAAARVVAGWRYTGELLAKTVKAVALALGRVLARAGSLELSASRIKTDAWKPEGADLQRWARENAGALVRDVDATTRKQLATFLASELRAGRGAPEIATNLRAHFAEFPAWRSDLIAREETKRYYNAGTLFAAQAAGSDQVQALDAQDGPTDEECERRNGRVFSVSDAWSESAREHIRGTLAWRIIPTGVQLSFTRRPREDMGDVAARIDQQERVIYLVEGMDPATEGRFLERAVDWLVRSA